jgi:hypothetical protein
MRNRHLPHLCRNCLAPMASQDHGCWRCGVEWASEQGPAATLHLVPGDAATQTEDAERWTNVGGNFASEVPAPLPATAAGR